MNPEKDIQITRKEYTLRKLSRRDVQENPFKQFEQWFSEAIDSKVNEPSAMILSTVDEENRPDSRVVLLKQMDTRGFYFYTNYNSRKGTQLSQNPFTSLLFFWPELERQVRINGKVQKTENNLSDRYFSQRPLGSQIGAVISRQSEIIGNRDILEKEYDELLKRYPHEGGIKRPEYWGGFIVIPHYFEFWQGRPNRLNDRLFYSFKKKKWEIGRLAP